MSEQKTEWEVIEQDRDLYVTRATMESIPKKPPEEEPEPPEWQKLCPESTVDEYGQDKWVKQAPNDVPVQECGFSAVALEQEFKE